MVAKAWPPSRVGVAAHDAFHAASWSHERSRPGGHGEDERDGERGHFAASAGLQDAGCAKLQALSAGGRYVARAVGLPQFPM
jgi:hypothetical protein